MSRRGTGGGDRIRGALDAVFHGNVAGTGIAHAEGDGEWMYSRAAMVK